LYRVGDGLQIAVDETTFGNDSRFCRRSADHNADLRHVVDKAPI
jgi:hypothetical protein